MEMYIHAVVKISAGEVYPVPNYPRFLWVGKRTLGGIVISQIILINTTFENNLNFEYRTHRLIRRARVL